MVVIIICAILLVICFIAFLACGGTVGEWINYRIRTTTKNENFRQALIDKEIRDSQKNNGNNRK